VWPDGEEFFFIWVITLSINNFKGNPEYESYTDSIFQGQSLALPKKLKSNRKIFSIF